MGLETVFVGPVTGFARLKMGFAELIQPFFGSEGPKTRYEGLESGSEDLRR